jgi:hypothetical protein
MLAATEADKSVRPTEFRVILDALPAVPKPPADGCGQKGLCDE